MTSPANTTVFRSGSFLPSRAPALATEIITVGTQNTQVTFFSSIRSISLWGYMNRISGMITSLAPVIRQPYRSNMLLSKWNPDWRPTTEFSVSPKVSTTAWAYSSTPRWGTVTPLGTPVEPEVYMT